MTKAELDHLRIIRQYKEKLKKAKSRMHKADIKKHIKKLEHELKVYRGFMYGKSE